MPNQPTAPSRRRAAKCLGFIALVVAVALALPPSLRASNTVVLRPNADPYSGIAIQGVDAVSYFGPDGPQQGLKEFEINHLGVAWRFANVGDYEAFKKEPEPYIPAYLGYDALAIAGGRLVAASAWIYLVREQTVYLFSSHANRDEWQSKEEYLRQANQWWEDNITRAERTLRRSRQPGEG